MEVEPILAEEEDVNNVKKDVKRVHGLGNKGRCSKSNAKKTYSKKRRYHPPKNPVNKKKSADTEAPSTSPQKDHRYRYK